MRLKYKWSILIVCVLLFCTACSQSDNEVSERIGYDFPQSFNVEIDENIKFNTEIIVNEKVREHGLYYTTATIQKKDDDKAYNILFDGIEIVNNFEKSKGAQHEKIICLCFDFYNVHGWFGSMRQ